VKEALQEHHIADVLLRELADTRPEGDTFGAKMKVLQEGIEHHIEEEEGELFPQARRIIPADELARIGREMRAMKQDAKGRAA
jgi:hemerythrin-like domain-containing protein